MEAPRRIIHLGHLAVSGSQFEFKPASQYAFEVEGHEEVELQVTFSYTEDSLLKEACSLRLSMSFDGTPLASIREQVRDRPFLNDRYAGKLTQLVPSMRPGYRKGTFVLEALSTRGSWFEEKPQAGNYFRREELFTLHVR